MYEKQSPFTIKHSQLKYSPITEKSMQSSHYVQQIASFQSHPTCYHHTNDYISHICLNCNYVCLCGTCLKQGHHKTHNIKNIQKSVKIIDRMLNQYAIRLRSKSDILTLLNQSLDIQKTEIYQQYCEYKKLIQDKFSILLQAIAVRQQQMLSQLKAQQESYFVKIEKCAKDIAQQTKSSINLISTICQNRQKLQPTALCLFFSNRKQLIESALNQQNISKLKSFIPDNKLSFDCSQFDTILQKIRVLDSFRDQKINNSTSSKKLLKKSSKNLTKTVLRSQKQRDSFPINIGAQTPKENKCSDSHKDMVKFFRSPNSKNYRRGVSSGKLMSMPTSPQKQKISKNPSPSKAQNFKKKVRKNKK